jgi:hypothetical protein
MTNCEGERSRSLAVSGLAIPGSRFRLGGQLFGKIVQSQLSDRMISCFGVVRTQVPKSGPGAPAIGATTGGQVTALLKPCAFKSALLQEEILGVRDSNHSITD